MKCECLLAGYCNRHKVRKSARMVELCQTHDDYRDAWEQGRGPGQITETNTVEREQTAAYNHWMPLHGYAPKHWHDWDERAARAWYRQWQRAIPSSCGCAGNWKKEVSAMPVQLSSPQAFFEWTWRIHDAVNERLGKHRPTLEEAYLLFSCPHPVQ